MCILCSFLYEKREALTPIRPHTPIWMSIEEGVVRGSEMLPDRCGRETLITLLYSCILVLFSMCIYHLLKIISIWVI